MFPHHLHDRIQPRSDHRIGEVWPPVSPPILHPETRREAERSHRHYFIVVSDIRGRFQPRIIRCRGACRVEEKLDIPRHPSGQEEMICKMTNAALLLMEFQICLRKTTEFVGHQLARGLATYTYAYLRSCVRSFRSVHKQITHPSKPGWGTMIGL